MKFEPLVACAIVVYDVPPLVLYSSRSLSVALPQACSNRMGCHMFWYRVIGLATVAVAEPAKVQELTSLWVPIQREAPSL